MENENNDLENFLEFVRTGKVNDDFTKKLASYVEEIKQDPEEARRYAEYQKGMEKFQSKE